jgi:hypothetical protein
MIVSVCYNKVNFILKFEMSFKYSFTKTIFFAVNESITKFNYFMVKEHYFYLKL